MAGKRSGSVGIFAGFAPWIIYWVLSSSGRGSVAAAGGLAAGLALCGWRLRHGWPKPIELVAVGFFASHAMVTVAAGGPVLQPYDGALVNGALALMAWATLLVGSPFTGQYAREDWPAEYWESPIFRRINFLLTSLWGMIFTTNTGLGLLSLEWPGARLWLVAVLPQLGIAAGVWLSLTVPRWYSRRRAARELAEREPYRWPPPTFGPRKREETDHHDVIVVGAGIGGLTAAALLADRGLSVLVLDQHYLAGGFCTSWPRFVRRGDNRLRYVFDAGVHDVSGLGPRGPVRALLERLGIEDRIEWRRMTHEYRLPGLRLTVPHRADELVSQLAGLFPGEGIRISAFFAEMEAVYRELYADVDLTGGVPCPPRTVEEMLAYPARHPHAFRWMSVPFGTMLDRYFEDPRLKELLSALTGYLSDNPRSLTATAMAPIFGYYFDGGFYPVGGSQSLSDALVSAIQSRGGAVRLRTPVRRILVEQGRAVGVELDNGKRERAGAVVSNADLRRTFLDLVGRGQLPTDFLRHLEHVEPSASAFMVFLGVDYVPGVEPITIQRGDGQDLFIAVTSKLDPSLAPPGHASVSLVSLIPAAEAAGWDRKTPGYALRKRTFGDELIRRAEQSLPGLREHIVYRQDGSPATFARYAWTTGGAIYGPAMGQWRPPAKSPVEGLVLAGAAVFPGAGVEAVVISGTLAADAIHPAVESASAARRDALVAA